MEHADPSDDPDYWEWDTLPELVQEIYRTCVSELLVELSLSQVNGPVAS